MSTTQMRVVIVALLFVGIFLFGFWLSRSGKPYSVLILTLHKLISLGALVFLAVTVYKLQQVTPLSPAQSMAILATAFFFVATIVTGGLLSVDKAMPAFVHRLHQITPYLTMLSTAASFYLLPTLRAGVAIP